MVYIELRFFLFCAILLLLLPLPWVLAAVLAAAFHELCHIGAVFLFHGNIQEIRLDVGGAVITAQISGAVASAAASLAGPAGSLLLTLLCRSFPRLAVCGCIQGLYNLLPLSALDGGRALKNFLEWRNPRQAEKWMEVAEITTVCLLLSGTLGVSLFFSLGIWPFLLMPAGAFDVVLRKIPCKQR